MNSRNLSLGNDNKNMIVKYLASGWDDEKFEEKLQTLINSMYSEMNYKYYDIKISSNGNHCMVIFKKE